MLATARVYSTAPVIYLWEGRESQRSPHSVSIFNSVYTLLTKTECIYTIIDRAAEQQCIITRAIHMRRIYITMRSDEGFIAHPIQRTRGRAKFASQHESVKYTTCFANSKYYGSYFVLFLALYTLAHHPEGCGLFRVYGQPHERLCSLPVSVLFPRGQCGKNQPRGQK